MEALWQGVKDVHAYLVDLIIDHPAAALWIGIAAVAAAIVVF